MRDPDDIRRAIRTVADAFHVAKLCADKCDNDEQRVLTLLRRIDSERAGAVRRMEMYHQQYDALQDELDGTLIAQAETMVTS